VAKDGSCYKETDLLKESGLSATLPGYGTLADMARHDGARISTLTNELSTHFCGSQGCVWCCSYYQQIVVPFAWVADH
jgi:hypothetical protein